METSFPKGGQKIFEFALLIFASRLGTLIGQTGWVARVDLLILLVFSLFSWGIIFEKFRLFRQAQRETSKFLRIFRAGRGLPDPQTLRGAASSSPLVAVYAAGHERWQRQLDGNPHAAAARYTQGIAVEMQMAAAEEVRRMERWMPWLATTGSVTPFIGLFGTVWGVMDAFLGLGEAGAASLRATAPGIAEALVTTAAGLFAAIPAVIGYNHYLHRVREFSTRMDNFILEVMAQIEMHNG